MSVNNKISCFIGIYTTGACGKVNDKGPHSLECLRWIWSEVGCWTKGRGSPDNNPTNLPNWNRMAVKDVRTDMEHFFKWAVRRYSGDTYQLLCFGNNKYYNTTATGIFMKNSYKTIVLYIYVSRYIFNN